MASSYSTDLKLELMVTGEKAGLWGDITNTNLNLVQQAIAGFESISIAGGAQTTTLVMTDATLSNARNAVIKLTGTITGNQVVTIPTGIEKTYIVSNGTVGAFTVEFKQAGGTGTTFSTTDKGIKILFADGTNIVDVNANFSASSFEQINLPTQNELRFEDSTGGQYVALKAGATVTSNLTFTLPTADGSSGQFLQTDGSGSLSFAAAGIAWQTIITGATLSAVAGRGYWINTTSNACTVTLPASATNGDTIILADYARKWGTNAVTINQNSLNFQGNTSPNPVYNTDGQSVTLVYSGATQGWIPTVDDAVTLETPQPYSIDFLVIAGGGGGGSDTGSNGGSAAGGGAGGYRTSTQSAAIGTVITVTVGDGGAGAVYPTPGTGSNGSNSSISGSGLTGITSTGGGGGASYGNGADGGSGGGAAGDTVNPNRTGGVGNTPSTSPSQGNSGGIAGQNGPNYGSGGGGGAGAVGVAGTTTTGGDGGAGTASSITGSSVTRAGGGGGTSYGGTLGTGGSGGGGNGGGSPGGPSTAGTANTGGGGGGQNYSAHGNGSAGGKGVVILSVPTASYSSTTTGSPTVTTSGANTIMQFNGSGSYTA